MIKNTNQLLSNLPQGNFICAYCNSSYKWYVSNSGIKKYIPKKQQALAEKLAYRKYLSLYLSELEKELRATCNYISVCSTLSKSDNYLSNSPEIRRLVSHFYTPISEELSNWSNSPYEHNPYHPEGLIHKSISGKLLRSKSESIIDMLLFKSRIPYRYECPVILGTSIIYPDFTIRHPITGKIFYWEHFGQMDNPEYYPKACSKLELYISNGIIPSINLITTFETKSTPLISNDVQNLIDRYFL